MRVLLISLIALLPSLALCDSDRESWERQQRMRQIEEDWDRKEALKLQREQLQLERDRQASENWARIEILNRLDREEQRRKDYEDNYGGYGSYGSYGSH